MLAASSRLRRSAEFSSVLRGSGSRRAGSRLLVLWMRPDPGAAGRAPRAGLIVSKAVGNAVVRNRTKRVLRHQLAGRLVGMPDGTDLVVRANPAAADADSRSIGDELDRLIARARRGTTRR